MSSRTPQSLFLRTGHRLLCSRSRGKVYGCHCVASVSIYMGLCVMGLCLLKMSNGKTESVGIGILLEYSENYRSSQRKQHATRHEKCPAACPARAQILFRTSQRQWTSRASDLWGGIDTLIPLCAALRLENDNNKGTQKSWVFG